MKEIPLRYGCNPHQRPARLVFQDAERKALEVLNGEPSYINILDAVTGWQLAQAYVRARGADRVSSFGDAIAVSGSVGIELAEIIRREVSDLIIAPGYEPAALNVLREEKQGRYLILQVYPDDEPPAIERRDAFGFTLEQQRNAVEIERGFIEGDAPLPNRVAEMTRCNLDLAQEAVSAQCRRQLGPQDLHGYLPAMPEVFREEHRGHASGADLACQGVPAGERFPQNFRHLRHRGPGDSLAGIPSRWVRLPPRIASLSASRRNDAFRMRSTVTGQLYGISVP